MFGICDLPGLEANEGRVRMIGSGEAAPRTGTKIPTKWAVLPQTREVHMERLKPAAPISGLNGRDPAWRLVLLGSRS